MSLLARAAFVLFSMKEKRAFALVAQKHETGRAARAGLFSVVNALFIAQSDPGNAGPGVQVVVLSHEKGYLLVFSIRNLARFHAVRISRFTFA